MQRPGKTGVSGSDSEPGLCVEWQGEKPSSGVGAGAEGRRVVRDKELGSQSLGGQGAGRHRIRLKV